jgi:hypothetical protein
MGTDLFQITDQFNITEHIKEISHRQKTGRRKLFQHRCQQPSAYVPRRDFTWHSAFSCQIAKTQCSN